DDHQSWHAQARGSSQSRSLHEHKSTSRSLLDESQPAAPATVERLGPQLSAFGHTRCGGVRTARPLVPRRSRGAIPPRGYVRIPAMSGVLTPTYEAVTGWEQLPAGYTHPDVAAVAVNSKGRVYLFCRSEHPVMIYEPDGRFVGSW